MRRSGKVPGLVHDLVPLGDVETTQPLLFNDANGLEVIYSSSFN